MEEAAFYAAAGALVVAASTAGYMLLKRKRKEPEAPEPTEGGTPWYLKTEEERQAEQAADASSSSPAAVSSANKKKKPAKKKVEKKEETSSLALRPQLPFGSKVYHRTAEQMCEVVKVYFDDSPPYYQVRAPPVAPGAGSAASSGDAAPCSSGACCVRRRHSRRYDSQTAQSAPRCVRGSTRSRSTTPQRQRPSVPRPRGALKLRPPSCCVRKRASLHGDQRRITARRRRRNRARPSRGMAGQHRLTRWAYIDFSACISRTIETRSWRHASVGIFRGAADCCTACTESRVQRIPRVSA